MIADYPALGILIGLLLIGTGAYMWTRPRRLFTRADDPSEYRPGAVELESDQGRWLTRVNPPISIALGLFLVAISIYEFLPE